MSAGEREGHLPRRRDLLVGGACVGASLGLQLGCSPPSADRARGPTSRADPLVDRGGTLVLLELVGGCDPLSVLVPLRDEEYRRLRPTVGIAQAEALAIDDECGLHPALRGLREQLEQGRLALVQGVGYPRPYYSHFRSQEVWHTGRLEGRSSGDGWIGRLRAEWEAEAGRELVVHVGSDAPYSLHSARHAPLSFQAPDTFRWLADTSTQAALEVAGAEAEHMHAPQDGASAVLEQMRKGLGTARESSERVQRATEEYRPRVEYPATRFGQSLRAIAALIHSDFGARVYSLALGNFDSHGETMKYTYAQNLAVLDGGLSAFAADLAGTSAGESTLLLAFSEFGRRAAENQSRGTDHGDSGWMCLLGAGIQPGLHGERPSLADLDENGNVRHTLDFRRVYAAVLERHFGVEARRVLGEVWSPLPLFRS